MASSVKSNQSFNNVKCDIALKKSVHILREDSYSQMLLDAIPTIFYSYLMLGVNIAK